MTHKPKNQKTERTVPPAEPTSQPMVSLALNGADPPAGLEDEIALQRLVNDRLLSLWNTLSAKAEADDSSLQVKVARALTAGTGRVAHLLRDRRALSGEAGDGLAGAIAQAVDELNTEMRMTP